MPDGQHPPLLTRRTRALVQHSAVCQQLATGERSLPSLWCQQPVHETRIRAELGRVCRWVRVGKVCCESRAGVEST